MAEPRQPEVSRWVTAGILLYPAVTWGFAARLEYPLADAAFVAGLVVLLPLLAVAQIPLVKGVRVERVPAYVASAVSVAALGAVAAVLGSRQLGLGGMGLRPASIRTLSLWTAGLVGLGTLIVLGFHWIRRRLSVSESPILRELLPQTALERRFFIVLTLCAGFGEELAIRGYALPMLARDFGGGWGAAVMTSAVFGLLHAYQGPLGMVRTATLGLGLAVSFVLSGSLWPCIAAHVALDLLGGLVWGKRLTG